MTQDGALSIIADGHTEISIETAQKVLDFFGLGKLPDDLIDRWEGQADANPDGHYKGLWLNEDKPGQGVYTLRLSEYVLRKFGLTAPGFHGRGSQARANAAVVRKYLEGKKVS